jgi:hypothetical protein
MAPADALRAHVVAGSRKRERERDVVVVLFHWYFLSSADYVSCESLDLVLFTLVIIYYDS